MTTIIRVTGGLVCVLLLLVGVSWLVSMSSESVIKLLLVSVQTGIGPSQRVHLSSGKTLLHVCLIIEVRHVPAIFLVIVVVSIGRARVTGGNALGIGCRGSVVEVGLASMLAFSSGAKLVLLWFFSPGCPDTNHPNEKHQENDKDDRPCNSSGDVCKLTLLLAVFSGE